MNKIELKNYPLSTKVVKEWFMKEMIESFKDETVPSEFKDYMLEQGIEDKLLEKNINVNPRMTFDFLDKQDLFITVVNKSSKNITELYYSINNDYYSSERFFSRKEAEFEAVWQSFNLLEDKLNEERINIIAQNGNTGEHYQEESLN